MNRLVEEIASRISVGGMIPGGAFVPLRYPVILYGDTVFLAAPAVRTSFVFSLKADGHVTGIALWGSTLNDALEVAVWRAIVAADSAGVIPPFPREVRHRELLFRILVEPEQLWNEPPPTRLTTRSDFRPLFLAARPLIEVSAIPSRPLGGDDDTGMRSAAPADTLQFVLSETGTVLPGTLAVSPARSLEAAEATLGPVALLRFTPIRSGDCPVPVFVQIPVR